MKLKVGDKVSFLNEKRDGIIKKVINENMVSVEIEDGFDIPVLANELIKTGEVVITGKQEIQPKRKNIPIENFEEETEYRGDLFLTFLPKVEEGVYLSYLPEDESNLLTGNIGIYILNHTSYKILFSYSHKENDKFVGVDYDIVEPETKLLLEVIDRDEIEKWSDLYFQIIFFKSGLHEAISPINNDFRIKPVKFYSETSYQYCSLLDYKCIVIPLSSKNKNEATLWTDDMWRNDKIEKPKLKIIGNLKNEVKVLPMPEKHIIEKDIAEVDLHINELVNDFSRLSNGEMLLIQINYFRKSMESALANNFSKIIFIHGVGNGVLKAEIRKQTEEYYPKCKFYDAQMSKYGQGATEIDLSFNKNKND